VGKHRDWTEIAKDYRENGLSLTELAEKYEVSVSTLKKAAMRQGWSKGRVAPERRRGAVRVKAALAEVEEMEPETEPENGTEMEPAEMEPVPNGTEVENKVVPLYPDRILPAEDEAQRFQRLVDELMNRVEDAICNVDVTQAGAVKLLTGALKDLRSLKGLDKTPLDIEEQRARIEKLRSETRVVEDKEECGVIFLPEIEEVQPPE
jgi:transposase-like protein